MAAGTVNEFLQKLAGAMKTDVHLEVHELVQELASLLVPTVVVETTSFPIESAEIMAKDRASGQVFRIDNIGYDEDDRIWIILEATGL